MQVYFIVANNPQDFDDDDIWVSGLTKDAAESQLKKVIAYRWEEHDKQTKDFYENDPALYECAWKYKWAVLEPASE